MRTLAPLPALLLLAAAAAACPFGVPGHSHPSPGWSDSLSAPSEGRCTGRGPAPSHPARPSPGTVYDLREHPIPREQRPYWEMLGYRLDDASGRLRDPGGALVSSAAMDDLQKPFDASYQSLNADLWSAFMMNGYRLDEQTCRLIGTDAKPLDRLTIMMWDAMNRRGQSHAALESLLAKLRGLPPGAPVPENVRNQMLALEKAGTELPAKIKAILARSGATVGELRGPTAASYADSTKFFDGRRTLTDTVRAVVPAGSKPGVTARRKGIPDPYERALGRTLSAAFAAEMSKTSPGRELLSHFRGKKGADMPDVMVLKLTQSPNDPHAPGAVYDSSSDRMVINHWEIVRLLRSRLPPGKVAKISGRLGDAKQLSKLLAEDPALLTIIVDNIDVMYFHELTHAAQARRSRLVDELLRGNLPAANPLSLEHEAHRAHCGYLLSKSPAAIARSDWREYCLDLIRNPDAFKDRVTNLYLSTFSGSSTLDDVRARQEVRRAAARSLESAGGVKNWLAQKLKQFGFGEGDAELARYKADVDKREKEFLAGIPQLRREAGEALVGYYEKTGAPNRALALAVSLPPGSIDAGEERLRALTDRTISWVTRSRGAKQRDERLNAVAVLTLRLKAEKRAWPQALIDAKERDGRSYAEERLSQALAAPPAERARLLDEAKAWSASLRQPGDLPARIERARRRTR